MELEEIREVARRRMSHDEVLEALRDPPELPELALGMATLRAAEFAPDFLALIDAAVEGTLAETDEMLLFHGVHVLGASRDRRAFRPLLRLLHLPLDRLDRLLGDARTMTLQRIIVGVFDDSHEDATALCELLSDSSVYEYVRHSLFGSLAFLTWEGRIDRETTIAFLRRFEADSLADRDNIAWCGWWEAIALLGARELVDRVEAAFADGRVLLDLGEYDEFAAMLARAEAAPQDRSRFEEEHLGYIEDIVGAFSWVSYGERAYEPREVFAYPRPNYEPVHDPWRHVGRNDPCPCGSGKKAKRCCLQG